MADKPEKKTTKQKQTSGGSVRKKKCQAYRAAHIREKNKIRRVLRSSGPDAVKLYADKHGLSGYLAAILAAKSVTKKTVSN